jgi:hypothetical protein
MQTEHLLGKKGGTGGEHEGRCLAITKPYLVFV